MLSTNLCYQYLRILFVHSYNTGKYHLRPCYIKEIQYFLRTEKHADKMKVGGPPEESWLQKRFSGRRGRKNRKMKIYYKTRSFNNRFDTTLWWETQLLLLLLFCFVLLWFQIFFVCWKGLQNNCHISDPIEPQWEIRGSLGYNEYSDWSFPRNVPLFTAL